MKAFVDKLNLYGSLKEPFYFLISYDLNDFYIEKLKDKNKNIKFEIDENRLKKDEIKNYYLNKYPISFNDYKEKFNTILNEIKDGNSYLLNLTSKTKIDTNLSLDEIYENSNSLLKLRVKTDKNDFVCFSPEKFVDIINNKIYTYPMKGTIDSSIKDAKNMLINSTKELAEHTMVVDLLRNDLGQIAKEIKVEEFRYISKIKTKDSELFQTSSKISAKLENNCYENLGDIFEKLLPAGSITGTPKKSTIDILKRVENYDRGFYTGVFGYFDGKTLQSFVLIRFIENIKGELFYKSGGGITADSDVNLEYEELINKVYLPF
ncbi:aminodeoxychorismate synthase component I [Arcobacter porcinus]|uniref:Aminodeoxychorismate synthase component 1 n=1 Tax=Arcobacter porcinus TaxID=1935204 RepID=A0A1C0AYF6_9BACT|nr:aminodeoxychorismate synthase component I [Arcobacter porcinus]OCL90161.1 Aminodeoxychorismate synthase component 1 [Aliarcobacter thereius]OCL83240.1 Aminodeoxychorismate synthase component 1 [Arcobacter porcinus]OCL83267.1 Aminodeoxychorismate synthase component 1 [Arcobacter porcinus]OCL88043.1 Aminodeoxychorismate synthase component 1 [Arcobacter porcinus]OCL92675.1 Aminodeoxychorismate synthase component 1 [Arcobacter porcinus]